MPLSPAPLPSTLQQWLLASISEPIGGGKPHCTPVGRSTGWHRYRSGSNPGPWGATAANGANKIWKVIAIIQSAYNYLLSETICAVISGAFPYRICLESCPPGPLCGRSSERGNNALPACLQFPVLSALQSLTATLLASL